MQKALRRGASRSWGWGRSGEAAPLSRPSYAIWGATFLVIGAVLSGAPRVEMLWLTLLVACFIALCIAGAIDVRAERKRDESP